MKEESKEQEINPQKLNDADMIFLLEQAKRVDEESIAQCNFIKNLPYSVIKEIK